MKKITNLLGNIVLMIFVVIIFLFILEIVIRFYFVDPAIRPDHLLEDNETNYVLKPSFNWTFTTPEFSYISKTNPQGYRDADFSNYVGASEIIFSLGDSFTFGYGVEENETFSYLLEENSKKPVLNLGVFGYSTIQEYYVLKRNIKKYPPKLVILNFFIENDILENAGIMNHSFKRKKELIEYNHNTTFFEKIKTFFRVMVKS